MLLPLSLDNLLSSPAVDPALESDQLLERDLMYRLQLVVRSGCVVEYAAQFLGSLNGCQQELLTLSKIRGKRVVVIHNDHCSSDSFRLRKTISRINFEQEGGTVADGGAHCAGRDRSAISTAADS